MDKSSGRYKIVKRVKKNYYCSLFVVLFLGTLSFTKSTNDSVQSILDNCIEHLIEISDIKPDSVISISQQHIKVAQEHGFKKQEAHLERLLGLGLYYKGNYAEAFNCFNNSYEKCIAINDTSGMASAMNNLSLIYGDQGYTEKALHLDSQILQIRQKQGDPELLADAYNNLAVDYFDSYQDSIAMQYYKKALSIYLENNIPNGIDLSYNNIAGLFLDQENYDSARYYAKKSLEYSLPINNKQISSNSYRILGDIHYYQNEFRKALPYYEEALKIAQETNIVYEIEFVAETLHECYYETKQLEKAYEMLLLYKAMSDSSRSLEAAELIAQTESENNFKKELELTESKQRNKNLENKLKLQQQKLVKYIAILIGIILSIGLLIVYHNYRNKIKDNLLLRKQKQEIEVQKEHIEHLNMAKDKFMAIIAHDLRNPIGGIYKLSEALDDNYDILSKEKIKKYVASIRSSSNKVYELLENLLYWASIQRETLQKNKTDFNLYKSIQQNIELFKGLAQNKKISITNNASDKCMVSADKSMIETVIRNLISNSIKFTPKNGNIIISVENQTTHCKFSIKNSGPTISEADQKIIFDLDKQSDTLVNSKDSGVGLGLPLCKEFVEKNSGQIGVNSKESSGTTFFFTIPTSH